MALDGAAALVNTMPLGREGDGLSTVAELDAYLTTWQFTGRRRLDRTELSQVRELRTELREFWTTESDEQVVDRINQLLKRARALPQVVRHDQWDWHIHATEASQPLAQRIAVDAAMAVIDLLRSGDRQRLRVCAADGCERVLVDWSKNRSRRFCDTSCANTTHVKAYRARKRARND
ncbi:CGNR zinc finger domain-containing protein [Naumannella halotolerans]|uniref:CGNR zinc finger domain-containing protein n=1 Tax=Naumannella halotolerans TaxID=993414 RepID=UPI00370D25B4